MKKGRPLLLLLPALLALFGFGVVRLLQLRFETGDIYPPYSSLRADPLGTRAFYESLETLRGMTVQRFIEQWTKLREGRNTTLFVFGADTFNMNDSTADEYKKLEQFMYDGGRIVVSFAPLNTRPWRTRRKEAKEQNGAREKQPDREEDKSDGEVEDKTGRTKKKRPFDENEEWPGTKRIPIKIGRAHV